MKKCECGHKKERHDFAILFAKKQEGVKDDK